MSTPPHIEPPQHLVPAGRPVPARPTVWAKPPEPRDPLGALPRRALAPAPRFTEDAPYGWFVCPASYRVHGYVDTQTGQPRPRLFAIPIQKGPKRYFAFCSCSGNWFMPKSWRADWGYSQDEVLALGCEPIYTR